MKFKLFSGHFFPACLFRSVTAFLTGLCLLSVASTGYAAEKSYLRLEKNKPSDLNDLKISTIGGLVYESDKYAHIDLSLLESDVVGNSLALDLGGGYVFGSVFSLYLGVGISLDYNFDHENLNDKYFAEAGIAFDITRTISITARKQHFFNQPDNYEEVIMFGLLFRH